MHDLIVLANRFNLPSAAREVVSLGSGIINDTYRVYLDSGASAVLQRINQAVFTQPDAVMQNIARVQQHVEAKSNTESAFQVPKLYSSDTQQLLLRDEHGNAWRAMEYIQDTESFDALSDATQAPQIGEALGKFHTCLSDLPVSDLVDTLPGFHITPRYLQAYDQVTASLSQWDVDPAVQVCRGYVEKFRSDAFVLENAKAEGHLVERVIHGDPKLNNVLFDVNTRKAVSIIDLDTVKPGLVHYDIGDCLRSSCNLSGEMPEKMSDVHFDLGVCYNILRAYFGHAAQFMSSLDYDYIVAAIKLIPYELGLRFFTDYLQGNQYFKVVNAKDNLHRANVQFRLLDSIVNQEIFLKRMLEKCK